MPKVRCGAIDCVYNDHTYKCRAKEVALSERYMHTVHEGFKQLWECKNYQKSEHAKKLEEAAKSLFDKMIKEKG